MSLGEDCIVYESMNKAKSRSKDNNNIVIKK